VEHAPVVIVGAGPAGIAAAIQLKRYNIIPVVFEQSDVGGLLRNAHCVENYPGFPGGIGGPELVGLFKKQLDTAGITPTRQRVREVDYRGNSFQTVTDQQSVTSSYMVIATGTVPNILPDLLIPAEANDRVYYEVYPLVGLTGKTIAIIGAGDAAFDYALSLSPGNTVLILNRSAKTKCLSLLRERCGNQRNITYLEDTRVKAMALKCRRLVLSCAGPGEQDAVIEADYLLIAIGRTPCLNFLSPGLRGAREGLVEAKRLYFVGDVKNGDFRQTAISVGDGLRAAMEIGRTSGEAGT